ncbi:zinc finger transcriptional factor charlatan isoform X1 [Rhodnius prolixus]|uniref:zinc finger transcriptional factor charlatan isoform X1 n=1 Tax=Rhodnius prolixus TaxID=13249 RepID=UPI003D18D74F
MSADVIDSYEDMFKEITRKLYGGSNESQQTATQVLVQHQQQGGMAEFEADGSIVREASEGTSLADTWIASDEALSWTQSNIASFNPAQNLFRCNECECVGFLSRIAEHWLGTHANLRVFQCPRCPYASAWARCVRMHLARQHELTTTDTVSNAWCKESPALDEVTRYLERLKAKVEAEPPAQSVQVQQDQQPSIQTTTTTVSTNTTTKTQKATQAALSATQETTTNTAVGTKRYNCNYCGYATDRRDLFTRHENIHRDDKPFHCYVCLKQFNRADHVKKHFVRMHRETEYDISRIKKERDSRYLTVPAPPAQPQQTTVNQLTQTTVQTNTTKTQISVPGCEGRTTTGTKSTSNGSKARRTGERRYSCCYCSWTGLDNWCLKRHLNTHLKPYVCSLCDYKAARAERLATHVFKVHNKRTCAKCSFLADDQAQLNSHTLQQHQKSKPRKYWFYSKIT